MEDRDSRLAPLGWRSLANMAISLTAIGVIGMTGPAPARADADDFSGPVVREPQERSEYREERREERPGAGVQLNFGHHRAGIGVGGGVEHEEHEEHEEQEDIR